MVYVLVNGLAFPLLSHQAVQRFSQAKARATPTQEKSGPSQLSPTKTPTA